MPPTRREFNQGLIATAVAAAVPLLPTPAEPKVLKHWYMEALPLTHENIGLCFCMELLESGPRLDTYRVVNLTDNILRLRGYRHRSDRAGIPIQLGPQGSPAGYYHWATECTWEQPCIELESVWRWRMYESPAPCDCEDGPHGTWCSNRNALAL